MLNKFNTKEVSMGLLAVMVASFIIAGILFFQSGGYNEILSGKYNNHIDETIPLKAEGVKQIKIACDSADVHIIPVDSNEINVHLYGNTGSNDKKKDPKLDAKIENGQLIINVKKNFILGVNFVFFEGITLEISVPKNYAADISVNNSSGNTKIEDLALKSFNCDVASGNISINSVTTEECILKLLSGNAKLESFSGNLKANSASGNVSVDYKEFNNNADISVTSGNAKLNLPSNAEFYLSASALSGNLSNAFPITLTGNEKKNSIEGTVVKDNNKITIKTFSGNIDITKY
jgi:lia operon protein LiaG